MDIKYPYTHIGQINKALYEWFSEQQQNVEMNESVIRTKALQINKDLNGDPKFNASSGWYSRWKIKCDIFNSKTVPSTLNINRTTDSANDPAILFIEPYYSGSHKQLIDTLLNGNVNQLSSCCIIYNLN